MSVRTSRLDFTDDEGSSRREGDHAFVTEAGGLTVRVVPPQTMVPVRRGDWLPRYVMVLLCLDTLAIIVAGLLGQLVRFASIEGSVHGVAYTHVWLLAAPAWLLMLAASRTYEVRHLGLGSEEFRRVANASVRFMALFAVTAYILKWDVARGLILVALPSCSVLTLGLRYAARKVLHSVRADGAASHRVLVVGEGPALQDLANRLSNSPHAGLRVVGSCRPLSPATGETPSVNHIRTMAGALHADTIAIAHSPQVTPDVLRRVAWSLEGTGANLLVAPALTDIAGPRINIRPVSGMPLLQIAAPEFTGIRRVGKSVLDRVGSSLLLLAACPLLIGIVLAVRTTSSGPALFRQTRTGRHGKAFTMYKFRSMYADAETRLADLRALNDHGDAGVMFKMREDPRITRIGKYLRRYSLDELPQLFNVLFGQMSLVGPRPPLPSEVAQYEDDVHRRLLVKPGLTGLWQVSGRSDLDWDETVRLDLYYVENWSVALDAEIAWKTFWAVLKGSGAR
jgi:exopolysaccharide biosynthesis polyprenyl glycosylphosphotransferase